MEPTKEEEEEEASLSFSVWWRDTTDIQTDERGWIRGNAADDDEGREAV